VVAGNGTFAFGGELLTGLTPGGRPYGGQLTLSGTAARSLTLGDGSARWQRFALGLGGHGTFGAGELKLELGAAFLAGLLYARGTGFLVSRSSTTFDPGIGLSTRLRWDFNRHWLAWLQAGASVWLGSERVQILAGDTAVSSVQIPPLDLFVTLGVSVTADL
jgi:hypothetical protein